MKPYSPTKSCPHRWCRPVHLILGAIGLASLGPTLWQAGWKYLVFSALALVIMAQVEKIAWKGKSAADRAMEDQVAQGAGSAGNMSSRHLVVRPVWARIAICMDCVMGFLGGNLLWDQVGSKMDYSVPTSGSVIFVVLGGVGAVVWFWNFSHRKATEPAKPLQVPVFVKSPITGE